MSSPIILDAGPLGKIAHSKPNPDIAEWYKRILGNGVEIYIPEVADYEVRRSLLLHGLHPSVERLDELKQEATYLPLTTAHMLKAAELWADSRKRDIPLAIQRNLIVM